jgi:hypothetical protein
MDRLLDEWCEAAGVRRVRFESFGHEPIREANRRSTAAPRCRSTTSPGPRWWSPSAPTSWRRGSRPWTTPTGGRGPRLRQRPPRRVHRRHAHQSLTDLNADQWIAPRPGTEHLVALAMARLVADETGRGRRAAAGCWRRRPRRPAEAAGVPSTRSGWPPTRSPAGRRWPWGRASPPAHAAATTLAVARGRAERGGRERRHARSGRARETRSGPATPTWPRWWRRWPPAGLHAPGPRAEPAVRAAGPGARRGGAGRGPVHRVVLALAGRDQRNARTCSSRTTISWRRGATTSRAGRPRAGPAGDDAGVRHQADGRRAAERGAADERVAAHATPPPSTTTCASSGGTSRAGRRGGDVRRVVDAALQDGVVVTTSTRARRISAPGGGGQARGACRSSRRRLAGDGEFAPGGLPVLPVLRRPAGEPAVAPGAAGPGDEAHLGLGGGDEPAHGR